MKRNLCFLFFLFFCANLFAQNRNSVWCFGDSAGIDFSSGAPVTFASGMDARGSCCSIADTSSNLLFYASTSDVVPIPYIETVLIRNNTHQVVQNGDSIVGLAWYRELIITDIPSSLNEYYLFSLGVTTDYGFYYSIVDMNQNGGLGAVTQKNVQLQTFSCADGIAAIKHGNGRDWWVFFRRSDISVNEFYSYLVTPSGISNVIVQNIGSATYNNTAKLQFSSDGSKLAMNTFPGLLEVYDFDRCNGLLSNPITIHTEPTSLPIRYFIMPTAFSPNNRFLYVIASWDTCYLYQYDCFLQVQQQHE